MSLKLDLVFRDYTHSNPAVKAIVLKVFLALKSEIKTNKKTKVELAVTVVGLKRISALNKRWRQVNKPTDILAFPLSSPPIPGYTALVLGDLFICPAVVRAKAKTGDNSPADQMLWTVIHGWLHLIGYDHEASLRRAKQMILAEQRIIQKVKRPHGQSTHNLRD